MTTQNNTVAGKQEDDYDEELECQAGGDGDDDAAYGFRNDDNDEDDLGLDQKIKEV